MIGEDGTGRIFPGGSTVEAGQVNRVFRVIVRCILKAIVPHGEDLSGLLT
jgi:hypothetical protein